MNKPLQYDFTLETEVKNVFERADAENEAIQTAETTENEENIALSEAFEDVEQVEVCDEPDGDNSSSAQIEAPPIPKRCFEKENNGKCIVQYVKYLRRQKYKTSQTELLFIWRKFFKYLSGLHHAHHIAQRQL